MPPVGLIDAIDWHEKSIIVLKLAESSGFVNQQQDKNYQDKLSRGVVFEKNKRWNETSPHFN
jgi:hypothetical protein